MTNQQLKAHCEDVIANPQDHLDWVVDMARVALASLEAEPVAWVSKSELALIRPAKNRCVESTLWGVQRFDEVPIYTAPPVPLLPPIELNRRFDFDFCDRLELSDDGSWLNIHDVVAAIRAAGGSVKE